MVDSINLVDNARTSLSNSIDTGVLPGGAAKKNLHSGSDNEGNSFSSVGGNDG